MSEVGRAIERAITRSWTTGGPLATLLRPLGAAYRTLAVRRARAYRSGRRHVEPSALPVVVVGNLSVGGTGKTPLTAFLVEEFRARGWRPGIVSRGHGGARHEAPRHVRGDDLSSEIGDEPAMLHRATGAPVCVCRHRARAVAALVRDTDCDLVLSDDGLQHLAMARDLEIVVVDAARGLGNGRSLPAGPLRDPPSRLLDVDLIAVRTTDRALDAAGFGEASSTPASVRTPTPTVTPTMMKATDERAIERSSSLVGVPGLDALDEARLPAAFRFALGHPSVSRWPGGERAPLASFAGRRVHAVAGIAAPERFFAMLRDGGLVVDARPLPDHHPIAATDLAFDDPDPVFVTEKDAARLVGVSPLPTGLHVVGVRVEADDSAGELIDALSARLRTRTSSTESARER